MQIKLKVRQKLIYDSKLQKLRCIENAKKKMHKFKISENVSLNYFTQFNWEKCNL